MKKTFFYSTILTSVLFLFSFREVSKTNIGTSVSGSITNNGKKALKASVQTPRNTTRGSISYNVQPGQTTTFSGESGDRLEVVCNGKKQQHTLVEGRNQNKITSNCN